MLVQTKVSKDMEKFEDLEKKIKSYDGATVDYYKLREITNGYREYLRLATKYMKSVKKIIGIHRIYGNILERMNRPE